MYINDVIRFVQRHYPSEYDPVDMYKWCDEVSAMLLVEDRVTYRELVLPVFDDRSVLLPEGIKYEDIVSVYADGHYIPKRDVRYHKRRLCLTELNAFAPDAITVVYRKPFRPIRLIKYCGAVDICPTVDGVQLADTVRLYDAEFIKGDSVLFINGDDKYGPFNILSVEPDPADLHAYLLSFGDSPIRLIKYSGAVDICPTVDGEELADTVRLYSSEFSKGDTVQFIMGDDKYGPCNIISVEPDPDNPLAYFLHFGDGEITDDIKALEAEWDDPLIMTLGADLEDPLIMRLITDETVCVAPYDTMYEDYVLAKICYFQHDQAGYNQHMSSFNSRLQAYKKWLIDKLPHSDGRFNNYW